MPFNLSGTIKYLTFPSLREAGVIHAVFTRHGGVSPQPWASLNVGGVVGDDPQRVSENRYRAFQAVGRNPESIYDVWQVHGRDVVCADSPRDLNTPHVKADVILTDQPGVTLFMRFADCVPILLCDPARGVVGIVHAGWQGTIKQAAAAAVQAMQSNYGSRLRDIRAAIGPSICANHYEVGAEVIAQVKHVFGDSAKLVLSVNGNSSPGKAFFDLWAANRLILERIGVTKIEECGVCTACNPQDWYSYRGEGGKTGRFGVLIAKES